MCFLSRWHPTHWLICAQSWHGCGLRDGDLRPLCEHGVASLKANGANACLVLDDQVALVPACAAAAFFFSGRGTPRRAHECETQPEDASDLRLTWNASISVSFPRPFFDLFSVLRLVTLGLCAGVSTPRSSSMCSLSRWPNRRSRRPSLCFQISRRFLPTAESWPPRHRRDTRLTG